MLEGAVAIEHHHQRIDAYRPTASRSRRPVVTRNGAPISFSGIACDAVKALIEVMPGITRTLGAGFRREAIRSVLS